VPKLSVQKDDDFTTEDEIIKSPVEEERKKERKGVLNTYGLNANEIGEYPEDVHDVSGKSILNYWTKKWPPFSAVKTFNL